MQKINKKMTIHEVLEKCPKSDSVLQKHFGFCAGCPGAKLETVALGAHLHNKDVNQIITEINEIYNQKEK
ncbi:hypothetical protein COX95_01770 [bacterium CG_4_10_14_0_2_um_filter_33_32]|nr:MAG: hypothetical protein AUJ93_02855 [bacterium CG2_30_33_46]PIR67270.1 MAG: hypothetical protein COU50_04130 [bacterium CG10_big_fil_rev_8_21_14_0_10_33_18]PIU76346.1 MAG: hypothetical protein COS74_04535 [bacterium CG06_land_8_20_14_3_00_33_50]PIZ86253.1 MAG: hypothetical protein COX95_01770 [bacterium CG_4_10_14_0_2_um_filter_33_32]PJA72135.1 MAG: hypothetical protein CO152_03010 [bacterium CG_4_9_14_3_um_filter_33_26]